MRTMRQTLLARCGSMMVISGLLAGCASAPSPLIKLREARLTLDRAGTPEARTPDVQARILEAEGAIVYAESEYRIAPDHPLSHVRAANALEKARAALELTEAARHPHLSAH
jgi:hypothetical protein